MLAARCLWRFSFRPFLLGRGWSLRSTREPFYLPDNVIIHDNHTPHVVSKSNRERELELVIIFVLRACVNHLSLIQKPEFDSADRLGSSCVHVTKPPVWFRAPPQSKTPDNKRPTIFVHHMNPSLAGGSVGFLRHIWTVE